ncbi:MAG: acyl-CoA dehydrogenase family protein [Oligoflexus sp.]
MEHTFSDFDLLNLDSLFSSEQKALMNQTRRFVGNELQPLVQQAYESETFPKEVIGKFASQGLLGIQLSGYGLPGRDATSYGLVMREVERCDSGLRSFLSVHSALAMYAIHRYGSEEQKSILLPAMGRGEKIGCFALTEPQGGSDPSAMQVTAENRNGTWVLNGWKRWVTNAPIADIAVVWAKTGEGVRGFLVPLSHAGVRVEAIKQKLSLRMSASAEVFFDQVELADDAILPLSKGLGSALDCLNQARYGIIWGVLGAAEACLAETLAYTKNRMLFKRSLSSFQLTQAKLADMFRDLTLAQLYAQRLGVIVSEKQHIPCQISLGKMNNVEIALRIARTCRDLLGANGILLEHNVMRHACNLETVYTYEGTHDIHRLIVGQYLTGEQAFS